MEVYQGEPGSLSLEACNDDFCDFQSRVRFPIIAGVKYYVRVGGSQSLPNPIETGNFEITITGMGWMMMLYLYMYVYVHALTTAHIC